MGGAWGGGEENVGWVVEGGEVGARWWKGAGDGEGGGGGECGGGW